jgi:dihydrolipoamide dehydrogenase
VLVLGSGYIAVELASVYAALGAEITIATDAPRLMPDADDDLVRPLHRKLKERLKAILTSVTVADATFGKNNVKVQFKGEGAPKSASFERVIVALGNNANVNDLGLDKTSVQLTEDGFVGVNDRLQTTDHRIHAVGDVTGAPLLADKALHQGRICGEVLAGWGSVCDARTAPMTVFTDPQIAWCGLTVQKATSEGITHAIAKIPWGASGRAVGMGRSEGMTKIIYDPDTYLVLGVGLCGPHACEMIAEGALAIEMGAVMEDLASTIHPHPTVSELISDAARTISQQQPTA